MNRFIFFRHPYLYPDIIYSLTRRGREFKRNCQYVHQVSDEIIQKRKQTLVGLIYKSTRASCFFAIGPLKRALTIFFTLSKSAVTNDYKCTLFNSQGDGARNSFFIQFNILNALSCNRVTYTVDFIFDCALLKVQLN